MRRRRWLPCAPPALQARRRRPSSPSPGRRRGTGKGGRALCWGGRCTWGRGRNAAIKGGVSEPCGARDCRTRPRPAGTDASRQRTAVSPALQPRVSFLVPRLPPCPSSDACTFAASLRPRLPGPPGPCCLLPRESRSTSHLDIPPHPPRAHTATVPIPFSPRVHRHLGLSPAPPCTWACPARPVFFPHTHTPTHTYPPHTHTSTPRPAPPRPSTPHLEGRRHHILVLLPVHAASAHPPTHPPLQRRPSLAAHFVLPGLSGPAGEPRCALGCVAWPGLSGPAGVYPCACACPPACLVSSLAAHPPRPCACPRCVPAPVPAASLRLSPPRRCACPRRLACLRAETRKTGRRAGKRLAPARLGRGASGGAVGAVEYSRAGAPLCCGYVRCSFTCIGLRMPPCLALPRLPCLAWSLCPGQSGPACLGRLV